MGVSHVMPKDEPFIVEHLTVFAALEAGDVDRAVEALRHHIAISLPKVIGRVREFRATHRPEVPMYASEVG
ncbi:hypothetical protein D3C84_1202600 [compost metagenome]